MQCEHYECRCARAAELAEMAEIFDNPMLLALAVQVHQQKVKCLKDEEGEADG